QKKRGVTMGVFRQTDKKKSVIDRLDIPLLVGVAGIVLFGLVMIYSASSYVAQKNYGNAFYYVFKQIFGAVVGFGGLFFFAFFDYQRLVKLRYIVLIVSFVLLIVVLIPGIGVENYGARRWIQLPFMTLQSSEIAKFGLIVFFAAYMAKHTDKMGTIKGILPLLCISAAMCFLILLEPNMSITICIVLLSVLLLFVGGVKIKYFFVLAIPIVALIPILILLEPYRLNRLVAFLNPWANPLDEGFQLIQSLYALGSGGFFGLGLFNSRQKFLFLPFAESDFIFSIIGEELGWFGCILVLSLYGFIILRAIKIARNAPDRFGAYLAAGIAGIIAIQVLINIAVVTGSIPPTGLPLPFISHGGSSLMVFLASIGILQNIHRQSHITTAIPTSMLSTRSLYKREA
ncbi:MAG: putative lipid II flippase FtsW, partial [Firmicutes bacterium]|nr:putative lipid II flippase FtsW [Bacillota bacterium]